MKTPVRVGIAGFGMAARVMHVPFLMTDPHYRIVAVLERHSETAATVIPGVQIVRTIEDLVALATVDLVVITTPNDTHFSYAQKALLAGKQVVVDKPFTITLNEAGSLVALARQTGNLLSVFQNRRYTADFLTVREVVSAGLLGKVVEYTAHYDRYRPQLRSDAWREQNQPGSGILYDLGAHLIDQALLLFGVPQYLYADIRMQRPGTRTDDYFELHLDYGFMKAILKAGMYVREHGPRFQVHGTLGSFIKCGEDPQEELLKQGIEPIGTDWGKEPENQFGILHTEKEGREIRQIYPSVQGSFGLYYKNLYETLVNGKPLQEKPEQGYHVIRLIELALMSSRKKAVVAVTDPLVS